MELIGFEGIKVFDEFDVINGTDCLEEIDEELSEESILDKPLESETIEDKVVEDGVDDVDIVEEEFVVVCVLIVEFGTNVEIYKDC